MRVPVPPSVLLTATLRWPIAARLAIAFADLDCRVEVLCPRGHPAVHTRAARRIHMHSTLLPLRALRRAIAAAVPDLVVPCDDDAAMLLLQLHDASDATDAHGARLRALIVRSLGAPQACGLANARGQLLALAADAGVCVPRTAIVATNEALRAWLAAHRLPAVLKIDATWGGQGVAIVGSHDEAGRRFERMAARPPLAKALRRLLLDRDPSALIDALRRTRRTVTVQDHVAGRPANRAIACWRGTVLAGISVEAIHTQHPTGPATVVRVIEHAQMTDAAERLARRLGLSGLWGLDFVIEDATGIAYLVEMNPRATPICHLPLGAASDLPAALCAAVADAEPPTQRPAIRPGIVALFPGEWQRDPASPHLTGAQHDVPWAEPGLVRDGVALPWSERGLVARAWARWRSWGSPAGPPSAALPIGASPERAASAWLAEESH